MTMPDPVITIGGLSFPMMHKGARVAVRISDEALEDHFGSDGSAQSHIDAYRTNSSTIDAKAIQKLNASNGQPVLLKTTDF